MSKKQSLGNDSEPINSHPIGVVERDTGIGRDTLRIWQRRYGFPDPIRNSKGERRYPDNQIHRLQRIRRLMDQGLRPGKIVPLSDTALAQLEAERIAPVYIRHPEDVEVLISCLREHNVTHIEALLQEILALRGLRACVLDTITPLLRAVGESWARGELNIYEEHLMSQILIRFLSSQIAKLEVAASSQPVLLGTLPGERHGIGLLMTAAVMEYEGVKCINLGVEVPLDQLVLAAEIIKPSVVGLTFSAAYPYGAVRSHLQELRDQLPAPAMIWAGGQAMQRIRKLPVGVVKVKSLDALPISTIR